ncbi:SMC family ATPase [Nocardia fluminea]|uniref:SMC family ATPase n=1 Tax=Nocardia fluminea TaxID=134984 RepID=UPI003406A713
MKPITLSIEGFRSYPERVTVDFPEKGLIGTLGDTGAGKSSLLEGVTFALFNRSSWDGSEKKPLIADQAVVGSVDLTFVHGGVRWHVHRTTHATNPNAGRHHLKNLDTGDEVDGATAVTRRIENVLQLNCETFLRVGLLPQGKFDQLLTSKASDRKKHLRQLFGAESLDKIHDVARDRAAELANLLATAIQKRKDMWPDPSGAVAEFGSKASSAEAVATRLDVAIATISDLQEKVSTARGAATAACVAAETLADGVVPEAIPVLDKLELVAHRVAGQRASHASRLAELESRQHELAGEIDQREQEEQGLDSLGRAEGILTRLAERAEGHRRERRSLGDRSTALAAESARISADEVELRERSDRVQPLIDSAAAATAGGDDIRSLANTLRMSIDSATKAALRVAETATAKRESDNDLADANRRCADVTGRLVLADRAVEVAEARQSALEARDRAALIAADVHSGEDCPVCGQQVPDSFDAGGGVTEAEIRTVKTERRTAGSRQKKLIDDLAESKSSVAVAERELSKIERKQHEAQLDAQRSADTARLLFDEFAVAASAYGGQFDAAEIWAAFSPRLTLAGLPNASSADGALTEAVTDAISTCESAVASEVNRLRDNAAHARAGLDADRKVLVDRQTTHAARVVEVVAAKAREQAAVSRTTADIDSLPGRFRAMLPEAMLEIDSECVRAAAAGVEASKAEMKGLAEALEHARAEAADLLEERHRLDREVSQTVHEPLSGLRNALNNWTNALGRAVDNLDSRDPRLPRAPQETGIDELRKFVSELGATTALVESELTAAQANHTLASEKAVAGITAEMEKVAGLLDVTEELDWTSPLAVRPLTDAAAYARKDAEKWRDEQSGAAAQIQQAADLDFAIAAGLARQAALEVLKKELVDARFLGHLTMLNTKSLLDIASSLLRELTDDQFEFAPNCDIVSRGSEVVHGANRLSGGEKFLASLALALALAELHSLTGPRLGSLFLDEGFATLDTKALHSALEVLRTQTGGDRIVMVISHLHAVAEAVDDVLWIERPTGGSSTARWLSVDEREALINADLASGLQSLT